MIAIDQSDINVFTSTWWVKKDEKRVTILHVKWKEMH